MHADQRDRPRAYEHLAKLPGAIGDAMFLPLDKGGSAVRMLCVSPALMVLGGMLQVLAYAITALELRRTRRRLRADLVPFPGFQAIEFSRTMDSASVRPATLDERLAVVERKVGVIADHLQKSEDEAMTQPLRDKAASALASQTRWRDFRAREPVEWVCVALFTAGVAVSVAGALI